MDAEGDRMSELLTIMDEYPEVETCIEVFFVYIFLLSFKCRVQKSILNLESVYEAFSFGLFDVYSNCMVCNITIHVFNIISIKGVPFVCTD